MAACELKCSLCISMMTYTYRCMDAGFSKVLRSRVQVASDFEKPLIRSALRVWVSSFKCTTQQLELDHGNMKRKVTPLSKWETIAARAVNAGARHVATSVFSRLPESSTHMS